MANSTDGDVSVPHGQSPPRTMPGQRMFNVAIRGFLRIPGLSMIVGARLITLHLVGQKSGRRYAVPVAYHREGEDLLVGTSGRWRHNLHTGQPVAVRLKGRLRVADVVVVATEPEVVAAYAEMSRANPTFARFNGIRLGDDGEPDARDLHEAWVGGARAIRLTPR